METVSQVSQGEESNLASAELAQLKRKLKTTLEDLGEDVLRDFGSCNVSRGKVNMRLSRHMYMALRASMQQRDFYRSLTILKELLALEHCQPQFILKTVVSILEGSPVPIPDEIYKLLSSLVNCSSVHTDEVLLAQVIHLLHEGNFEEAKQVASRSVVSKSKGRKVTDESKTAATNLLSGYHVVLQYNDCPPTETKALKGLATSLRIIHDQGSMFTQFFDTQANLLLETQGAGETESFIYEYVEHEYPKSGVLAPLQALTFVKKHMPQHHGLIFHLMELVVKKDPSHRFVLELCLKYLRNQKPKASAGSDSDADSILDDDLSDKSDAQVEEGDEEVEGKSGDQIKCLTMITDYLECKPETVQAWSIMAENLRNMFLKGNSEYHEAIFKIWDWIRRGRWLKQFFNLADHHLLDNQSRSCLTDRAVVCTLLESEQHPFVQQARNLVPNLTGQIVALRPAKHLYDRYAQSQAQEEETSFERCSQVLDRSRIGEEAAPNSSAQPAEDWGELTRRNAEGINALKKKGWPRSPVRRRRRRRRQSSSDEEEAGPKQNPPLLDRLRLRIQKTRNLQLRRRAEYEKDSDKSDQDELVDQVDEHDDVVCPTPVLQFSQPKKTHAATPRAENPFLMFGTIADEAQQELERAAPDEAVRPSGIASGAVRASGQTWPESSDLFILPDELPAAKDVRSRSMSGSSSGNSESLCNNSASIARDGSIRDSSRSSRSLCGGGESQRIYNGTSDGNGGISFASAKTSCTPASGDGRAVRDSARRAGTSGCQPAIEAGLPSGTDEEDIVFAEMKGDVVCLGSSILVDGCQHKFVNESSTEESTSESSDEEGVHEQMVTGPGGEVRRGSLSGQSQSVGANLGAGIQVAGKSSSVAASGSARKTRAPKPSHKFVNESSTEESTSDSNDEEGAHKKTVTEEVHRGSLAGASQQVTSRFQNERKADQIDQMVPDFISRVLANFDEESSDDDSSDAGSTFRFTASDLNPFVRIGNDSFKIADKLHKSKAVTVGKSPARTPSQNPVVAVGRETEERAEHCDNSRHPSKLSDPAPTSSDRTKRPTSQLDGPVLRTRQSTSGRTEKNEQVKKPKKEDQPPTRKTDVNGAKRKKTRSKPAAGVWSEACDSGEKHEWSAIKEPRNEDRSAEKTPGRHGAKSSQNPVVAVGRETEERAQQSGYSGNPIKLSDAGQTSWVNRACSRIVQQALGSTRLADPAPKKSWVERQCQSIVEEQCRLRLKRSPSRRDKLRAASAAPGAKSKSVKRDKTTQKMIAQVFKLAKIPAAEKLIEADVESERDSLISEVLAMNFSKRPAKNKIIRSKERRTPASTQAPAQPSATMITPPVDQVPKVLKDTPASAKRRQLFPKIGNVMDVRLHRVDEDPV